MRAVKRLWIPAALVATGAAFVVASAFVDGVDSTWWQSLFLNLGTAVALVFPIYWLNRRLKERVEKQVETANIRIKGLSASVANVENQVRNIQELTDEFTRQRDDLTDSRTELFRMLAEQPTREKLYGAIAEAEQLGLVKLTCAPGLRAPIQKSSNTYLALIRYFEDDQLGFQLQSISGDALPETSDQEILWPADDQDGLDGFFQHVTDLLYRARDFGQLDPKYWFERIAAALLTAFEIPDARPIVELVGDQWAMTDDTAIAVPTGYGVAYRRMPYDSEEPLQLSHVASKSWVDDALVDRAYFVGTSLLSSKGRSDLPETWPESVQRRWRRRP